MWMFLLARLPGSLFHSSSEGLKVNLARLISHQEDVFKWLVTVQNTQLFPLKLYRRETQKFLTFEVKRLKRAKTQVRSFQLRASKQHTSRSCCKPRRLSAFVSIVACSVNKQWLDVSARLYHLRVLQPSYPLTSAFSSCHQCVCILLSLHKNTNLQENHKACLFSHWQPCHVKDLLIKTQMITGAFNSSTLKENKIKMQ